ncbi:probable carboxylesterase 13 [Telopea speciosissima]|uniref:probable carboxylesterase 13 n=1 Tax=Telopea speciosissima TaxID=54955 RepID=UPI001CC4B911|nr:probable carboxylesterase 13 [Telopea speciosissima]
MAALDVALLRNNLKKAETSISIRLFLPKITTTNSNQKLPLLVYFHGRGFCIETPCSPTYHDNVSSLISKANLVAVSVDYRKASEHVVPTAHNDSWAALQLVASHVKGEGSESWQNLYADLDRVFMAGDSAGANITRNMALRAMETPLEGIKIVGLALIHLYLSGNEAANSELSYPDVAANAQKLWSLVVCLGNCNNHPLLHSAISDLNLERFPCKRVPMCIAEKDTLRDRGLLYFKILKERG